MLEFLFNVDPARLADARFELAWPVWLTAAAMLAGGAAALWLAGYWGRRGLLLPAGLRAALAALVVLALAQPAVTLRLPDAAAGPVAVLLDDTRSMRVADGPGGATRAAWVDGAFATGEGSLLGELAVRFDLRVLRFADRARPSARGPGAFDGAVSDPLGVLLDTVGAQGNGLAGVVLVSDGGQAPGTQASEALTRLAAAGVPVHVVAPGRELPAPDLAIADVAAPAAVLAGDTVDLGVSLASVGLEARRVRLVVRDNGVLVAEREIALVGDPARVSVLIPVRFDEPGLRRLVVQVADPADGDVAPGNDTVARLVEVRAGPVRVLHVEGEPRFEVKFLRRAVAGDRSLHLSSLVRTGDNRFLRLGIEDEEELADGFPQEARALFRYHVLVLGSIEAAAFTGAQLALLEDYVARRGASLLLLGGRLALAEGGFGDTTLADLLPVRLGRAAPDYRVAARVRLTDSGRAHPVTRAIEQIERALPLPALAVVNPVRELKPGATLLLAGEVEGAAGAPPIALLSHHRYGRGRVAVMAVRDFWRWRMHADVALDDRTHELLWRRLLRWLAREVPEPVELSVTPRLAAPGQTVRVRARVRDAAWEVRDGAAATLVHTTPLGEIATRELVFEPGLDAAFTGSVAPLDTGRHELRLRATLADGSAAEARGGVLVTEEAEEFRAVGLGASLLRRVAERTGGSYRAAAEAEGLAERVAATAPAGERRQRVALWNAPALLVALLALACGEWWLRRRRRLA